jgi:TolB-like protein/Tfp pilus assembly protein PilF
MTPTRFQTIEEIFLAALEQKPDQISAFLDTACEGDADLRREVEALLASDQRADRFIEKSAVGLATKIIQNGQADSLIGQTIGHYKISESIGTGGMGEVYLATDIVAGRKAALKLLPLRFTADVERLKRFQQEAHAVVGLNHPNILTVYEIGEDHPIHYIASELIEGETLRRRLTRGPMELGDAVDVAIQVASALAAAHQSGIVHRDIKPENIMLRPDGYVKVLDFGIAKLAEQELPTSMPKDEALFLVETNLGSVLGTVRYMSPEQARGGHVDKTTDIWSLGVVLYEMVSGHAPFSGDTPKEVMSSILEKEPPPLARYVARAPAELQQIVSKTLRKDPAQRYRDAHELLHALKELRRKLETELQRAAAPLWLRWARSPVALVVMLLAVALALALPFYRARKLTTSSPPPEKSIAVLPLQNLSEDKENAFFADGVQDELLSNLSKIKDLKVISRTSVMQYKSGTRRNIKEIAQQLGVSNVVEGSVRRSGDHVRVSVQLIDGRTDRHLWGENYDRNLADSLSLQGELARDIADAVGATLSPQEKAQVVAKLTNNPAAYDAYLRARAIPVSWSFTAGGDVEGAIRLYQEAVKLDPNFTLAWAYLSIAQIQSVHKGFEPRSVRLASAKDSLGHALALNPNLPEVHLARGYHEQDKMRALAEFRQAEQGLPNNAAVIEAIARVHRALGQWKQAVADLQRAIELDPRNFTASNNLALTYCAMRRFPEAVATLDRVLTLDPTNARALVTKTDALLATGDLQAAEPLLANPELPANRRATYALVQRNYAAAIEILSKDLAVDRPQRDQEDILLLAFSQQRAGEVSAAGATYQKAIENFRRELEKVPLASYREADIHSRLGAAYAGLGDAASAIAEGQKAMALVPSSNDPEFGFDLEDEMARIYARLGDADHAIPILKRMLGTSHPGATFTTPATLRLDPVWDPIRNDPRFQELAAGEMTPLPEKSIAVLPFENLSEEKANAYFAEGIQNEILTRLAAVRDLKVISRTSTAKYQSKPDNLKKVAQELGVSTVLEGAVQKAGDKVRVNVQLIDARADTHLWAKSYDRDFKDVLGVESELSQEIAEALRANLSPSESHVLASVWTPDAEAYDLFLRGEYELHQAESSLAANAFDRADAFYRQALERDPNFAQAGAELARSRLTRHWFVSPLTPAELEEGKSLIDRALALAPNSPEAHFAMGLFFYYGHRQYENALAEFNRTLELQPNNAWTRQYCAAVYRRRGEWERSLADFQRAQELDPRDARISAATGSTYLALRLWKDAERAELRALAIDPHFTLAAQFLLITRLNATGDVGLAGRVLNDFPEMTKVTSIRGGYVLDIIGMQGYLYVTEKRFTDAFRAFEKQMGNNDRMHLQQLAGRAALRMLAGQPEAAKSAGEEARPLLEARLRGRPDDTFAMTDLSWVYLALGRNADALRVSRQAADLIPIEKDTADGPAFQLGLAQIEVRAGAPEEAVKRLRHLLSIPAGNDVSIALLKIDPVWDPIRNRPDFQQLLSGPELIGPNK